MEALSNLGLDPWIVISGVVFSTVLVFFLYRRFLVSVFDPLILFMTAQIGDASILWALPMLFTYKWQCSAYMLCLWFGFAVKGRAVIAETAIVLDRKSLFDLKFILTILCVLIVSANLYLGLTAGFPLLTSDPTEAKFTVYTGGLGLVRRINTGPYDLFCAGCMLLVVVKESRRYALTMVAAATSLVMLGGGKSTLIPLLLTCSFATLHGGVCPPETGKSVRKYLYLVLGLGVVIALTVTTKEQGGLIGGIQGLVLRLLLAGDVIIFYYPRREIVMMLVDPTVLGYLHYISSDLQGLLRIGEYEANALGALILGSDIGGPNAQYFVLADLFFGPVLGCLYSFLIGMIIGAVRNGFFHSRTKSAFWLSTRLFLAVVVFDLATEAGLFVTEVAVTVLFVAPLYALARLFRLGFYNPVTASSLTMENHPYLTGKEI